MDVNDVAAALGVAALAPSGILIEMLRRANRRSARQQQVTIDKVDEAAEAAALAAELARPVGNGFAGDVIRRLSAVQTSNDRIERQLAREAEISGRTVARLDDVVRRLGDHIEMHLQQAQQGGREPS